MKIEKSPIAKPIRKSLYERPIKTELIKSPVIKKEYILTDHLLHDSATSISRSSTVTSESNSPKWTKHHWRRLEEYYIRHNRDYETAGSTFYYLECFNSKRDNDNDKKPLWPKEHVIWRSRCLDTNVRLHGGTLPSERRRK